jgi:hypothetical protein
MSVHDRRPMIEWRGRGTARRREPLQAATN